VWCRDLCASLAAHGQQLVDAFGIPEHLVAAPIAADWETYNVTDNQGELIGAEEPSWTRKKESELSALVAGSSIA
jgi:hypothetical protein